MDLISLYYFQELAGELHMTRTAQRLFISQQTLSNHIRRMEEELGVPLFKRKPALSLTLAGELLLSFAQKVNRDYSRLLDALSDIEGQEHGMLRLGGSTFRLNACLPELLPVFTKRYPQVEIRVTDAISSKLEPMVLEGALDFAVVLSGTENPNLLSRHLIHDQIYLCVSERLLEEYYGKDAQGLKQRAKNGAFVQDFERIPFCLMSNRMGQMLKACFDEAGVIPRVYSKSTYTQFGLSMCEKGLAGLCGFSDEPSRAAAEPLPGYQYLSASGAGGTPGASSVPDSEKGEGAAAVRAVFFGFADAVFLSGGGNAAWKGE